MRSKLSVSPTLSAASSLMRLALIGLLALAWAASSPAGPNSSPHEPAPVGLEQADIGQAVLTQRQFGAFVVRSAAPDSSRASLSGDTHQATRPGEVSLPLPPRGGNSTISAVHAPPERTVHAYDARAPPVA